MIRHSPTPWPLRLVLLFAGALAANSSRCLAADHSPALPPLLDPASYAGLVRPPEIVEMLRAVAGGSHMGPGEGWFHPGKSRYGWEWLAARHHVNSAGRIPREAFQGPVDLFQRLDRNHDGVLTAADFDWSDHSSFAREAARSRELFRMLDPDSNGRISRQEWEVFFSRAAKGKDYLTPDDLREALQPPPPQPGASSGGPSPVVLLSGFLSGELGSIHEGPGLGQTAPDFTLKTQDGKRAILLSQFRGKKPVVLIFGSFT
jgi:hypothetical protein